MTQDGTRQGKWARRSREEWQALLNRFDARRDSVTDFCVRESISEASYYRWRGLLSAGVRDPAQQPNPSSFLDLGHLSTSQPIPRLDLRLDLGGGLVLHLVRG